MSDVKWIKITTDIFDDEKIQLIESLPDADTIIVVWFKLLCLAGKQNNGGVFLMNDKIPYTDDMLAAIFRRNVAQIRLALQTFENFGMIEVIDGVFTIPNWNKHQTLEAYERKKERDREYSRKRRLKMKKLIELNGKCEDEDFDIAVEYFDHRCAYCGKKRTLTMDHVVSINDDGSTNADNIVPCCANCNSSKGAKDMENWFRGQAFFSEERLSFIKEYIESAKRRQTHDRFCSYSISTSSSNSKDSIEQDTTIYEEIIGYLNEKAGTSFRSTSKKTMELINGRLSENYTVDDFKKVIDTKVGKWKGTEYEGYLRPNTLFRPTNFENYLNEKPRGVQKDALEDWMNDRN